MKKAKFSEKTRLIFCLLVVGAGFLFCGFKLEKDVIQLSQTESVKAPEPGEEQKIKETPASPTFKMASFDDFMTSSPVQKVRSSEKVKAERSRHHKSRVKARKIKTGKETSTY